MDPAAFMDENDEEGEDGGRRTVSWEEGMATLLASASLLCAACRSTRERIHRRCSKASAERACREPPSSSWNTWSTMVGREALGREEGGEGVENDPSALCGFSGTAHSSSSASSGDHGLSTWPTGGEGVVVGVGWWWGWSTRCRRRSDCHTAGGEESHSHHVWDDWPASPAKEENDSSPVAEVFSPTRGLEGRGGVGRRVVVVRLPPVAFSLWPTCRCGLFSSFSLWVPMRMALRSMKEGRRTHFLENVRENDTHEDR